MTSSTRGVTALTAPPPVTVDISLFDFPDAVSTSAFGINDAGTIVGSYVDNGGRERGFIREGSTFTVVDYPAANVFRTRLLAINNTGQIVGCYYTFQVPGACYFAFLLDGGTFTPITRPGGAFITNATGINDAGDIVGFTALPDSAFLLRDGAFMTFAYPASSRTTPAGINRAREPTIVGSYTTGSNMPTGFGLTGGNYVAIAYPGATGTNAIGVNAAGQVVGGYGLPGPPFGGSFLLTGGDYSPIDIGGVGTIRGMNNANQIVGERFQSGNSTRGFVATLSGTAALNRAEPASGAPGQASLNVLVTGVFNHFDQTLTTASFGAGITVNNLTVHNPNQATANVTIAPGAALGNRTITMTTGAEASSLTAGFAVTSGGSPNLTQLAPNVGLQGQTNLDVVVTGEFTHFVQGTTKATIGGAVTVNGTTVQNATQATINITISNAAVAGLRTVTLTTGSEIVSLAGGFVVPGVTNTAPRVGRRLRTNVSIIVTAEFTHFAQGTTSANFGPGITVNSLTVQSATQATAVVSISGTAAIGPRTVTMTTGGEVVKLVGGFVVMATETRGDFDADGRSDLGVYRLTNGNWYVVNSGTGLWRRFVWGTGSDIPVVGDFDGDGRTDPAVYQPSTWTWFILKSSTDYTTSAAFTWGGDTDVPVPADYDGDGKTDVAVYRPDTGAWYVLTSSSNFATPVTYWWGLTDDVPEPGDYDGDGKADVAVYRPSSGMWFVLYSAAGYTTWNVHQWGTPTDIPVAADYDGDSKTDVAVYRPATATWYVLTSTSGFSGGFALGWGGDDVAAPGDYDGDGKTDPAVFRRSNGNWFIEVLYSSSGYTTANEFAWGMSSDVPILRRH